MFSGVVNKLRSTRGASLSMALLLMLVCVAVSSVVLAAATTASGRFSELRKMDQRYYNVMSAADFFWHKLESSEDVTIVRECMLKEEGTSYKLASTPEWNAVIENGDRNFFSDPQHCEMFERITIDRLCGNSDSASLSGDVGSPSSTAFSHHVKTTETAMSSCLEGLNTDSPHFRSFSITNPLEYDSFVTEITSSGYDNTSTLSKALRASVKVILQDTGELILSFANDSATDPEKFIVTMEAVAQVESTPMIVKLDNEGNCKLTETTKVKWIPRSIKVGT